MSTPKDTATDATAALEAAPLGRLPEPQIGPTPPADAFVCLEGSPVDNKRLVEPIEPPKPDKPSLKDAPAPTPVPEAPIPAPVPVKAAPIDPPKVAVPPAPSTTLTGGDEPINTPRAIREAAAKSTKTALDGDSTEEIVAGAGWERKKPPATEAKVIVQKSEPATKTDVSPWAVPAHAEKPKPKQHSLHKNPPPPVAGVAVQQPLNILQPAAGSRSESSREIARHADFDGTYRGEPERTTKTDPPARPRPEAVRTVVRPPLPSATPTSNTNPAKLAVQIAVGVLLSILLLTIGYVIRDSNTLVLTPNAPAETASASVATSQPEQLKKYGPVPVTTETLKDVAKANPGSGGTIDAWHWASNDWPVDPNKVGLDCSNVFIVPKVRGGFDTFDVTNCKVWYPPNPQQKTP